VIDDRPLLTRVLLIVWFVGTSTFTVSVLVSPPTNGSLAPLWAVSVIGYVMTAWLWVHRRELPEHAADVSGYLCCLLASIVTAASRDAATPFCLFYLWVTVVSCHFLPVRRAVPQILIVSPCYAVALALTGEAFPWFRWALLSLTVVVVGVSVTAMRARLAALVAVLADSARSDALTGLKNRRAFDETLDVELERAARTGDHVGLIIADLDLFKAINDEFGHLAGDEVLRRTAKALKAVVRRVDVAYRIGGEEFAVIVPGGDAPSVHLLAERVRQAVSETFAGGPHAVTMSLGVAVYPEHGADAVSVFAQADSACYQAKARGRNRSVTAPRAAWTSAAVPPQRQSRIAR
jgi:diguanylate cyclase (GGDEF)-like protein